MKIKTEEEILRGHIETCHTEDSYDYGHYKDEIPKVPKYEGGSGSGSTISGSCVLEEDIVANVNAGAISSGTLLAKGTTFTEAFKKLLVKYVEPTISINSSNTITEKWNPFTSGTTLTIAGTAGDKSATIKKIEIFKDSSSTPLTSFTYTTESSVFDVKYNYTTEINTTTTFKAKITDSNGHTATASVTVNVVLPYYYGVNALNTIEDVSSFTPITAVKGTQSVTYAPKVEYIYFVFDASYTLKDITDAQSESCKSSFDSKTITVTKNSTNYTYTLYVSKKVAQSNSYKLTFTFS